MKRIGSWYEREGFCRFRLWAPSRRTVALRITGPGERIISMEPAGDGYWQLEAQGVLPGTRYYYRLDGVVDRPDPGSHFQPQGVHGPSQVIDHHAYRWGDGGWSSMPLEDYVIYELHVGTFSQEGTFRAATGQLDHLAELGVTAVELMPVAQFPGGRNWGYDGTYPFAPQNTYGGPEGLKGLVDACHHRGIAVILDVVYNHLGPEGNYLSEFGPYFTDRYRTPWGQAVNFDGPFSDEVRHYFISNALFWVRQYHVDALRIDAIHGIFDFSATHVLRELAGEVHREADTLGRKVFVIAESDLNDVRTIDPPSQGGHGLDAQWNDDFHHALHTLLTGESQGYYQDFGRLEDLGKAFREGYVYSGRYSAYRRRRHGNASSGRPASQFVVFSQNHDQVGNRLRGDRLSSSLSRQKLRLAASVVLLSPFIPLIFMGEEYGETAPFLYFVSHGDGELVEAVRRGRREEFRSFNWGYEIPDPQDEDTFLGSKLDPALRTDGWHGELLEFYRQLITMRRDLPAFRHLSGERMETKDFGAEKTLLVKRWCDEDEVCCLFHFDDEEAWLPAGTLGGRWRLILDTSQPSAGEDRVYQSRAVAELDGPAPRIVVPPWCALMYRRQS